MRFGKLTVLGDAGTKRQKRLWRVLCDCGVTCVKVATEVRNEHTKSCGCLQRAGRQKTHGHRRFTATGKQSREYTAWRNMKARCDGKNQIGFHNYGGRGIRFCERWQSFEAFLADMGDCPDGLTLERNDVNGNYEPSNCRWATRKEQGINKRVNRRITFNGETLTISQWAEKLNLPYETLMYRLIRRMSLERAMQPMIYSRWHPEGIRNTT